tara:strand:- start:129 stop:758 length:630 start_codon:yes stop_codon:yes gene_type:complete
MSDKKEKDLSMTDEKWDKRIGRIENFLNDKGNKAFLKSTPDIEDAVDLIRMNIKRGNRTSDKRKNLWNQILIEGREWTMENHDSLTMDWPVSIGKESNLPQNVQISIKGLASLVEETYTTFWNENPIVQQITVVSDRNKELGGSPHENAEDYAHGKGLAVKQRFTKYFNDGRWNGELNVEEGFNISPPPAIEGEDADVTEDSGDEDAAL